MELRMKIAVFGAGSVGARLAALFTEAGQEVLICTRHGGADAHTFVAGASAADVIVLALPYTALAGVLPPLLPILVGKPVVDCSNPLNADWSPMLLGQENSAAEELARLLPGAAVIKAFNTIFADVMPRARHDRDGQLITAFIAGDVAAAKQEVMRLAGLAGFAQVDAGPLRMARYLEAMAHLNIQIAMGRGGGTNAAFLYHQVKA